MGRRDSANVRRGLTPIRRLLAAGVTVALATNNVRNPFTPVGTADLAHMTFLAAVAAHMGTPEDMRQLVAAVTTSPARMLRLPDVPATPADLGIGHRADLVVWDCHELEEIVARLAPCHLVIKRGRVSVEHERSRRERWRDTS
jgi:cytosine deaminase